MRRTWECLVKALEEYVEANLDGVPFPVLVDDSGRPALSASAQLLKDVRRRSLHIDRQIPCVSLQLVREGFVDYAVGEVGVCILNRRKLDIAPEVEL